MWIISGHTSYISYFLVSTLLVGEATTKTKMKFLASKILQLSNREVRHERMFKIGMMWIMKMCIKNRNTVKEISNM